LVWRSIQETFARNWIPSCTRGREEREKVFTQRILRDLKKKGEISPSLKRSGRVSPITRDM
jgi:hypothetical protein